MSRSGMMIVGVSGKAQHGKDAICYRLADRWSFTVIPMALALKHEVLARLPRTVAAICELNLPKHRQGVPIPPAELVRQVFAVKPPGIRELLQEYGTDVRRADEPNYWIDRWMEAASRVPNGRIACSDVRFINEAQSVRAIGGKLWRVHRPGMPDTGTHVSETQLDSYRNWDAVIGNNGDLAQLYDSVDEIVRGQLHI